MPIVDITRAADATTSAADGLRMTDLPRFGARTAALDRCVAAPTLRSGAGRRHPSEMSSGAQAEPQPDDPVVRALDVPLHGAVRGAGIAREDRRDDRVVSGLRDGAGQARPGDDAQHLGDLDLDLRLGRDQPARARGLGDRDVEASVGQPEGGELADGALGGAGGAPTAPGVRAALARSAASAAASPEMARRQSVSSRNSLRVGGSPASTSAAGGSSRTKEPPLRPAARLDEAGVAQDLQRLAQRHRCDAELGGELELARQPLAGREHACADGLAEAPDDLLDSALGLQRCERDVARGHDPASLEHHYI